MLSLVQLCYKTEKAFLFGMTIFYPFHTVLDEEENLIGSQGTSPFLPTPPMIIFMGLLGRWLEVKAVSQHDI